MTKLGQNIFVTGATGNVGREVVIALRRRGLRFRIGDRRPAEATPVTGGEIVTFDFLNADTFAPGIAGCDAVFLLRPPAISNTRDTLNRFIDVARSAGVKQIVFLSVAGAASNPIVPHHAVERHLQNGPPGWTILRPGFFSQNLESAYRQDIVSADRIYVPAGRGRVAFVDTRDLAEVAVRALTQPELHRGKAYTLTGVTDVSFAEVAALLTHALGRPIRYDPASAIGYVRHLLARGVPLAQALVQATLHLGLRFGQAAAVDLTLTRLLRRPPLTIAQYIRDRRDVWLPSC